MLWASALDLAFFFPCFFGSPDIASFFSLSKSQSGGKTGLSHIAGGNDCGTISRRQFVSLSKLQVSQPLDPVYLCVWERTDPALSGSKTLETDYLVLSVEDSKNKDTLLSVRENGEYSCVDMEQSLTRSVKKNYDCNKLPLE